MLEENMHKFRLAKEKREEVEKDKTPAEAAKAIKEMQITYEAEYALYLGRAMMRYQYREFMLAPYNFG